MAQSGLGRWLPRVEELPPARAYIQGDLGYDLELRVFKSP
jgi:hypothetical protein